MKKILIAIICFYVLVYILPLGVFPAFTPDETRYGEISREILTTGDYVVPRINGLHYFEKPAMGYWLNALSIRLFGENDFAIRLTSAISAGLTALLVYIVGAGFAGGMIAGCFSAAIFLTSIQVFAVGQFSVLDSMFSLFATASMAAFLFADTAAYGSRKRLMYLLMFGGLAGLAFLIKGFVAFVIPIISIVPFLLWEKRARDIFRIPWLPIGVAILVCLPWAVMIHLKEPDYWNFFVFHEHIQRFLGAKAQHSQPFFFFILLLPALALPWTFLFPAAVSGLKRIGMNEKIVKYLICWVVFPFLFFSASKGKLVTYILPCFPPLAVLLAMGLEAYAGNSDRRLIKKGAFLAGAIMMVLAIALFLSQSFGPFHFRPYAQTWKAALAGGGLIAWVALAFAAAKASTWHRQAVLFCVAPLTFMFAAHFAIPERVMMKNAPGQFLMCHAEYIHPETVIVSGASLTTSVCWYYKRSDAYVIGTAGELSYGLEYPDAKYRHLDTESFKILVEKQLEKKGQVVLVEETKHYKKMEKDLPTPSFIDRDGDFVFAVF